MKTMMKIDGLILMFAFMVMFMIGVLYGIIFGYDIGCHVIGIEINGDNSTEYLKMGNC